MGIRLIAICIFFTRTARIRPGDPDRPHLLPLRLCGGNFFEAALKAAELRYWVIEWRYIRESAYPLAEHQNTSVSRRDVMRESVNESGGNFFEAGLEAAELSY